MSGKRVISALIAVLMSLSVSLMAAADDITDKKNELENINDRIEQAKEKIDDLQEKISQGENQLKSIESNISKVDGEIKNMQLRIKDVENKIKIINKELDEAISEYDKQDTLMKSRINSLYKNGTTAGYMEIILGARSFGDFMSRYDILKRVIKYDIDMLKTMKSMRDEIEKRRTSFAGVDEWSRRCCDRKTSFARALPT